MAQTLKKPPAMQETCLRSLGREDPLQKEMAKPFQDPCLENFRDGGAWRATVHGVARSRTQLSWASVKLDIGFSEN